jgi:putative inorganic carbon (HCO3(-)) transporter
LRWRWRETSVERALFLLFALLMVWLPIPLGSNRPWAWTVLEVSSFALLAAWLVAWSIGKVEANEVMKRAWPAWAAFAAWILFEALHVLPLPIGLVSFLSPGAAKIHGLAREVGAPVDWVTLSIDPQASRVSLLKTLAYGAIFFLTIALAVRRSRVMLLAQILVYAAVGQSLYAVLMHLSGSEQVWFGSLIRHGDMASGTFVNRNHLAGFLEMSLAIGIGLLIAGLSDRSADTWKKFVRQTLDWILSSKMILRLSLCVIVIALTTTHSRMGNGAFFASLILAGICGIALSRFATRNTVLLLASLVVIDLVIVGSWFGVEKLAKRVQETTMQDVQEREEPPEAAMKLIRDFPAFGAGPGSFYLAFPPYRTEKITAFFDHAHNDYIEFAAESGVPGLAILGLFVLLSIGAALRAQWERRDPLMRGMSFACIMGVTSILIHSWVDFNLQIPSNAALFVVLCAFGWLSLYLDRREGAARTRNDDA